MGRASLAATAIVLLAASAGVLAVALSGREPPLLPSLVEKPRCLDGLPGAARALAGLDVDSAATLYRNETKTVDLDNETILASIALSRATGEPIEIEDVTNFTIERVDVCSFALTAGTDEASSSVQRVIAFRTRIEHNATLSSDNALRAILLNATGVPIHPKEVISFRHYEDTQRSFDRELDLSDDSVLLALQTSEPEDRPLLRAIGDDEDAPDVEAMAP